MPISVYVNRSSFIDGFRAMPTTSAANNWPMPWAHPPTATMAMAQPSTDTPALRLLRGAPRPGIATALAKGVASRGELTTGPFTAGVERKRQEAASEGRPALLRAVCGMILVARASWNISPTAVVVGADRAGGGRGRPRRRLC